MKGLSPLIAIVLIVAFVVAIAGIISVWLSGLTTQQTETIGADSESFVKCASNTFTVSDVKYLRNASSSLVNVTAVSGGSMVMKNITVTIVGAGGTISSPTFYNGTGESLPAGGVFAASVDALGINFPPQLVTVRGLCEGRVVIGNCEEGRDCMEPV